MLFPRNAETICATFDITDDNVIEGNETFEVVFEITIPGSTQPPDIPLPPVNPTVTIIDDDCKYRKYIIVH